MYAASHSPLPPLPPCSSSFLFQPDTGWNKKLEEAVGRILYPEGRRPFIWAARHHAARAANPGTSPTKGGMRGQATLGPPIWPCSAWGLPCPLRFRRSGALLPHPFTLTPGLSGAVYSLRHFPSRCRGRALPGMPSVVESGPSSETEVSADARLLQPASGYHLARISHRVPSRGVVVVGTDTLRFQLGPPTHVMA